MFLTLIQFKKQISFLNSAKKRKVSFSALIKANQTLESDSLINSTIKSITNRNRQQINCFWQKQSKFNKMTVVLRELEAF